MQHLLDFSTFAFYALAKSSSPSSSSSSSVYSLSYQILPFMMMRFKSCAILIPSEIIQNNAKTIKNFYRPASFPDSENLPPNSWSITMMNWMKKIELYTAIFGCSWKNMNVMTESNYCFWFSRKVSEHSSIFWRKFWHSFVVMSMLSGILSV